MVRPQTLDLAVNVIQQAAKEAALRWLKKSCLGTKWTDRTVNDEALYDFNSEIVDHTVADRALSLQTVKTALTQLLLQAKADRRDANGYLTLLSLVPVTNHCIAICSIAEDRKCKDLLDKAKEKIEWLHVGLDAKRLALQQRASEELGDLNRAIRKLPTNTTESTRRKHRQTGEVKILDRVLIDFEDQRLENSVEFMKTIKHLLKDAS